MTTMVEPPMPLSRLEQSVASQGIVLETLKSQVSAIKPESFATKEDLTQAVGALSDRIDRQIGDLENKVVAEGSETRSHIMGIVRSLGKLEGKSNG